MKEITTTVEVYAYAQDLFRFNPRQFELFLEYRDRCLREHKDRTQPYSLRTLCLFEIIKLHQPFPDYLLEDGMLYEIHQLLFSKNLLGIQYRLDDEDKSVWVHCEQDRGFLKLP